MSKTLATGREFAKMIYDINKSDRYALLGVAGFPGEGKSTFSIWLQKIYSEISGTDWNFDRLTWSRNELLKWVDGEGEKKEGQLPEYSAILPDELFQMFYRRSWFEREQIDAIATFNMCRDRHLFVAGNVPDIWDLDAGFLNRLMFYIYIPYRGTAWVFQPENNPFTRDKWNVSENKKTFRKAKNPYKISNFVCEIKYPDMTPEEKKEYLRIRNTKRVLALKEPKEKKERYGDIKDQRDNTIRAWYEDRYQLAKAIPELCKKDKKLLSDWAKAPTNVSIADTIGLSRDAIRLIKIGER